MLKVHTKKDLYPVTPDLDVATEYLSSGMGRYFQGFEFVSTMKLNFSCAIIPL